MQTTSAEPPPEAPPPAPPPPGEAPAVPPRRRRRLAIAAGGLVAFAALLLWLGQRRESANRRAPRPPVPVSILTATAQRSSLPVYLDAIGTVTPLRTTLITSQVNGQVLSVHYAEGQLVERGKLLVEIDPRPFAAALLQAEGTLERDTQLLAQAEMDLERYRAAWAKKAIARQQLDDQEKLVLQTRGTVKNDRGAVQAAAVQVDFCRISAPISGRVGLRLVDPGNVVSTNAATPLAVITQLKPITVVFIVSEDDLGEVLEQARRGSALAVDALDRAKTKRLATGRLLTFDNQIDTTTGTIKLRAEFPNDDDALFPNQFVNTRLLVRTVEDAITVPTSAVQHDATQPFVYVVQDAHAHLRHVKTGVVEGETSQVEGIEPGTVVANSSFERLQDGVPVAVRNPVATREGSSPP